jgi:hypothetical protein
MVLVRNGDQLLERCLRPVSTESDQDSLSEVQDPPSLVRTRERWTETSKTVDRFRASEFSPIRDLVVIALVMTLSQNARNKERCLGTR